MTALRVQATNATACNGVFLLTDSRSRLNASPYRFYEAFRRTPVIHRSAGTTLKLASFNAAVVRSGAALRA